MTIIDMGQNLNQNTTASNNIILQQMGYSSGITLQQTSGSMATIKFTFPAPRKMYCDRREHRLYRAIRETCPCFQGEREFWFVPEGDNEGIFDHDGVQYFINKDGLVYRVSDFFRRLGLQEELINELKKEITRLRK